MCELLFVFLKDIFYGKTNVDRNDFKESGQVDFEIRFAIQAQYQGYILEVVIDPDVSVDPQEGKEAIASVIEVFAQEAQLIGKDKAGMPSQSVTEQQVITDFIRAVFLPEFQGRYLQASFLKPENSGILGVAIALLDAFAKGDTADNACPETHPAFGILPLKEAA